MTAFTECQFCPKQVLARDMALHVRYRHWHEWVRLEWAHLSAEEAR